MRRVTKPGGGGCEAQGGGAARPPRSDKIVGQKPAGHDVDAVVWAGVELLEGERVGDGVGAGGEEDGGGAAGLKGVGRVDAGLQGGGGVGDPGGVRAAVAGGVVKAARGGQGGGGEGGGGEGSEGEETEGDHRCHLVASW